MFFLPYSTSSIVKYDTRDPPSVLAPAPFTYLVLAAEPPMRPENVIVAVLAGWYTICQHIGYAAVAARTCAAEPMFEEPAKIEPIIVPFADIPHVIFSRIMIRDVAESGVKV